jgi:hypothetical protein
VKELTIATFLFLICAIACEPINRYLSWEDENIFEETGEFIFEKQTGLNVDFTPTTPEK